MVWTNERTNENSICFSVLAKSWYLVNKFSCQNGECFFSGWHSRNTWTSVSEVVLCIWAVCSDALWSHSRRNDNIPEFKCVIHPKSIVCYAVGNNRKGIDMAYSVEQILFWLRLLATHMKDAQNVPPPRAAALPLVRSPKNKYSEITCPCQFPFIFLRVCFWLGFWCAFMETQK